MAKLGLEIGKASLPFCLMSCVRAWQQWSRSWEFFPQMDQLAFLEVAPCLQSPLVALPYTGCWPGASVAEPAEPVTAAACSASGSLPSRLFTCISRALVSVSQSFPQLFLTSRALALPELPEVAFLFLKVSLRSLKSTQPGLPPQCNFISWLWAVLSLAWAGYESWTQMGVSVLHRHLCKCILAFLLSF